MLILGKWIPYFSSTPTETPVPASYLFSRHEVVVTQRTVGGSFTWRGGWKRNRTPLSHQIYNWSKCPTNTEGAAVNVIFGPPGRATLKTQSRFLLSSTSYSIWGCWEISCLWKYKSLTDANYVRGRRAWNSRKRKKRSKQNCWQWFSDSKYGPGNTELWKSTDFCEHRSTFFSLTGVRWIQG